MDEWPLLRAGTSGTAGCDVTLSRRIDRLEAQAAKLSVAPEPDRAALRERLLRDLEEAGSKPGASEPITAEWIADTKAEAAQMPDGIRRRLLESLVREAEAERATPAAEPEGNTQ